jgi:hypothetical protein
MLRNFTLPFSPLHILNIAILGILLTPDGKTIFGSFNRYTHLFLIERGYIGFNTLESVIVE